MSRKIVVSFFLIFCFFAVTPKTYAALARIQAFTGSNTTFSSTVTTSSVTVTAGNLIVCGAEADVVNANGITMTDSKGNAWTRATSNSASGTFDHEIWYAKATTGGSSYTVTAADNGGGVDSLIICEEWSGQDTGTALDKAAGAQDITGISGALNSGNTAATTVANELLVGSGAVAISADTLTLGSGYSNKTQINTAFSTLGFETKVVSATGAYNATFTAGTVGSWVMQIGTFKEAVAATPYVPQPRSQVIQLGSTVIQLGGVVIQHD